MSTAVKTSFLSRTRQSRRRRSVKPRGPGPIDRFLDAVWMERGLSPNTLAAYRADLTALERWLDEHDSRPAASRSAATSCRSWPRACRPVPGRARPRASCPVSAASTATWSREGALREDPTAQIAMPKVGRSLPKSLMEEEVEALLAAPTVGDPLGHRDRTMLEVLYATGLRVSELVNLKHRRRST